jgi:hypothetical protein
MEQHPDMEPRQRSEVLELLRMVQRQGTVPHLLVVFSQV